MKMISKTKDYDRFKFREDNRCQIDQGHVKKLIESIRERNLLEMRPIYVNENFEVIDGQHRLLAAQALNVDIYFKIEKNLRAEDIILMNINKSWGVNDFLNYYCVNNFEEYKKLRNFVEKNNLPLRAALSISIGYTDRSYHLFKTGKFIFDESFFSESIIIFSETIDFIRKMNNNNSYTASARFWKAGLKLIKQLNFNKEKWMKNLTKMVERFSIRASEEDYYKLMLDIYNWRNSDPIEEKR